MKRVDPDALKREQVALGETESEQPAGAELRALMDIDGVEGFGLVSPDRAVVYVRSEGVRARLPVRIDGMEIQCEVSGSISTLGG